MPFGPTLSTVSLKLIVYGKRESEGFLASNIIIIEVCGMEVPELKTA